MPILIESCAAALAALLVMAGTIKIVRPASGALALRRTFRLEPLRDHHLAHLVRGIGGFEVATGTASVASSGATLRMTATATAALFTAFVAITAQARTRGVRCGCWGSLSSGPAGLGEVRRRLVLATLAVGVATGRWVPSVGTPQSPWPLIASMLVPVACGAGLLIACDRLGWIPRWLRVAAAFGPEVRNRRTRVGGAARRRLLNRLRADATVLAVIATMEPTGPFFWRRADVTGPATGTKSIGLLVSVPGKSAKLRVVAVGSAASSVIGDTDDRLLFGSDGVVVERRKYAYRAR
ncbi:MAG: MauE/DoxX family redox-associated membrane protein [Labedaea sp.]